MGAGPCRALVALIRGLGTDAEAGCVLLASPTGAGLVRAAVPVQSRVAGGGGGSVGQEPT